MAKAKKKRRSKKFVFTKARRAALRKAQAANRRKGRGGESKAKRSRAAKKGARKRARKSPARRGTKHVVHHHVHELKMPSAKELHRAGRTLGTKGGRATARKRRKRK